MWSWRRVAVPAAVVVLAVVLPARPASAHATLLGSDPANGATVPAAPRAVVLRFSQAVTPQASSVRLIDGTGLPVDGARLRAQRGPGRTLTLDLPRLVDGAYAVVWQVQAPTDPHPASGIVIFAVHSGRSPAGMWAVSGTFDGLRLVVDLLLVGALAVLAWRRSRALARLAVAAAGLGTAAALYRAVRLDSWFALVEPALLGLLLVPVVLARARASRRVFAALSVVVLVLAAGVVGAGAVDAAVAGPGRPAAAAPPVRSGAVDDLVVSVSLTPNRPGVNGFTVRAASNRRPAPAPIDGVAVQLGTGGGAVPLREVEPGHYVGTGTVGNPGDVRLVAVISRAGAHLAVPVDWSVAPAVAPAADPGRVGARAALLRALALGTVGGVLALGLWWLVLGGRRWRVRV